MIDETDLRHLRRCVELAAEAVAGGHMPFGSVLVSEQGEVLFEDHNRIGDGDGTRHPEFAIARWAAANLAPDERAKTTVYTSGEHCPMCAAAHGFVGLGRIVYATSSEQLSQWFAEMDVIPFPVKRLPIETVIEGFTVEGPVSEFAEEVRELHRRAQGK